ncbi:MAG: hypothetical protein M3Z54_13780, partial [Gemmatimonadota bacterium]|nr:hypothetical protein [Gemmatimonadota bacterium]
MSARQGANGESQEQISGAARTAQAPISLLLLAQRSSCQRIDSYHRSRQTRDATGDLIGRFKTVQT